jgi:hypothetical protein
MLEIRFAVSVTISGLEHHIRDQTSALGSPKSTHTKNTICPRQENERAISSTPKAYSFIRAASA